MLDLKILGSRMILAEYITARPQGAAQPRCDLSQGV
eukprot:CAMPEP_0172599594 /NCGR_PEP_ID=MMETSP1068-20121228/19687_1 /TAXON_ID=35684 /ORGANISM="Pseudopedinella elastica, Strain CCMP716" /LENGTH=35 /DNA_ID= /DNA_START= /DNA_END= /DNA_ORIENTATION=